MLRSLTSMRLAMVSVPSVVSRMPLGGLRCRGAGARGQLLTLLKRPMNRPSRLSTKMSRIRVRAAPQTRSTAGCEVLAAVVVDHRGQRRHQAAEQVAGDDLGVRAEDEQRRGLAHDPGEAEQDAGDDARERRREHDLHDRLPLRHAERVRRLAQLVGHELEHLLGGAHHRRDHQEDQGEASPRTRTRCKPERRDPQGVDEQGGDDRGDAGEDVDHEARPAGPAGRGRTRRGRSR